MRTCLQIGLNQTAEYIYLTEPNWVAKPVDSLKELPSILKQDKTPFRYYGVDCGLSGLEYLRKKHHYSNAKWINAFVIGDKEDAHCLQEVRTVIKRQMGYDSQELRGEGIFIPETRFSDLLKNIHYDIDVLAMDIEGGEHTIFEEYDFKVKPTFVAVEVHPLDISCPPYTDVIKDIFLSNGYVLHKEVSTNNYFQGKLPGMEMTHPVNTMELQFLLSK